GAAAPLPALQGPADPALVDALRSWRATQAKDDGVAAFVVLSNAHLEGIARAHPASLKALARCKGMGPIRLERYGDAILELVEQSRPSNG
ncbi:MAG: HRDC domain-containing protein, partial [Acidimicrobiales bacterium]